MRTIKSAISDRLVVSFLKWQEVTTDFVEDLTKSFDGLQELTLSQTRSSDCQKNADTNTCSNEQKGFISDTESFDSYKVSVNKDCTNERPGSDQSSDSSIGYINSNVKQLSIGTDRKFEYIKTGIYKCTVARNQNHHQNHSNENGLHRVTSMDNEVKNQNIRTDDAKKSYITNILSGFQSAARITPHEKFPRHVTPEIFPKNPVEINQDVMEMNLRKNPKSDLLQKVCFIEESKFFFSSQFTKNYVSTGIISIFIDLGWM